MKNPLDNISVPKYNETVRYRIFYEKRRAATLRSAANEKMNEKNNDVLLAALKLSRAMRRCPPDRGRFPFPPAVSRLLTCVAANSNVSSRELCEMMDIRPSSLSELLARSEEEGWIIRTVDEEDRRIQRVSLSSKGQAAVQEMETVRQADLEKKTACLTEEEKIQFCILCDRLSVHLEKLALELPEPLRHGPGRPPKPGCPPCGGFPPPPGAPDGFEDFPPAHGKREDHPAPPHPGKPVFPPETRFRS